MLTAASRRPPRPSVDQQYIQRYKRIARIHVGHIPAARSASGAANCEISRIALAKPFAFRKENRDRPPLDIWGIPFYPQV